MATRAELTQYGSTWQDVESPDTSKIVIYQGRCYKCITKRKESVGNCFKAIKLRASQLYGPPYPPLTTRQVVGNYCGAGTGLVGFGVFGCLAGVAIFLEATNPAPDRLIHPVSAIVGGTFVEGISLAAATWCVAVIHKTCKAPRVVQRDQNSWINFLRQRA